MRALTLLLLVLFVSFYCCGQGFPSAPAQDGAAKNEKSDPIPKIRRARPKVSLQGALKLAEDFISQQNIDIGPFWLYRATYMLEGDEKTPDQDKIPGWHFLWIKENGYLGDEVEIFVDMNGKAYR